MGGGHNGRRAYTFLAPHEELYNRVRWWGGGVVVVEVEVEVHIVTDVKVLHIVTNVKVLHIVTDIK